MADDAKIRPTGGVGRAIGWSSVANVGRQLTQIVTTVILARLLVPADFGLVSIALILVGVITIFKDVGTGAAVIQRPNLNAGMLSTIFWSNVAFGGAAAAILVATAPVIAALFREPGLTDIVRALSVSLVVSSVAVVPLALLERGLRFGEIARLELAAVALGGLTGIAAAIAGLGAWSLVAQTTVTVLVATVLSWRSGGFRPELVWHRADARAVGGFSAALTGFNLFNYAARNADNLIIGRALGTGPLGQYALAYRLMVAPIQTVTWTVNRVMFPVYAGLQHDDAALRSAYLRATGLVAFFAFPMVAGIGAVSDRLVATVFGAAWVETGTVLAVLVPVAALQTVLATTGPIYQAKGRTHELFLWGLFSGGLTVVAFVVGLQGGIVGVAVAYVVITIVLSLPGLLIPYHMIQLDLRVAAGAVAAQGLAATLMAATVVTVSHALPVASNDLGTLVILVVIGVATYGSLAAILDRRRASEIRRRIGSWWA